MLLCPNPILFLNILACHSFHVAFVARGDTYLTSVIRAETNPPEDHDTNVDLTTLSHRLRNVESLMQNIQAAFEGSEAVSFFRS